MPLPLLEAIDELSEAARHWGLVHLQAAEFLYETSLFPERVYTFKHALTHEVPTAVCSRNVGGCFTSVSSRLLRRSLLTWFLTPLNA